jgi:hypothetical protein
MGDVNLAEVVRRGLMLLDVKLAAEADEEELVIRNRRSGDLQRIRFEWDTFDPPRLKTVR